MIRLHQQHLFSEGVQTKALVGNVKSVGLILVENILEFKKHVNILQLLEYSLFPLQGSNKSKCSTNKRGPFICEQWDVYGSVYYLTQYILPSSTSSRHIPGPQQLAVLCHQAFQFLPLKYPAEL